MARVKVGDWEKELPDGTPLPKLRRLNADFPIAMCCGAGTCGICGVEVLDGDLPPPDEMERLTVKRVWKDESVRLACRCIANGTLHLKPLYPNS